MKNWIKATMVASVFGLAGCATIIGDSTQTIPIVTNPDGVNFKITDESGVVVQQGVTPARVTLNKHNGGYFGKKQFQVTFEKEGYQPVSTMITANANGKYILGNFFLGGPIGWLVVDPFNGGMYNLNPSNIAVDLSTQ